MNNIKSNKINITILPVNDPDEQIKNILNLFKNSINIKDIEKLYYEHNNKNEAIDIIINKYLKRKYK
jgi:hypothetical protein